MTDFGEKLAEEIGARDWARKLADTAREQVAGKIPHEIQEFCLEYVQTREYEPAELERLMHCAYDNGIPLENVKRVLGIMLRDRLLELVGSS